MEPAAHEPCLLHWTEGGNGHSVPDASSCRMGFSSTLLTPEWSLAGVLVYVSGYQQCTTLISENLHTHQSLLVEPLIKINESPFFTGGSPIWGT